MPERAGPMTLASTATRMIRAQRSQVHSSLESSVLN
mgnify:CR=1 FL=1